MTEPWQPPDDFVPTIVVKLTEAAADELAGEIPNGRPDMGRVAAELRLDEIERELDAMGQADAGPASASAPSNGDGGAELRLGYLVEEPDVERLRDRREGEALEATEAFIGLIRRYFAVDYRNVTRPDLAVRLLQQRGIVELAYDKGMLAPPPTGLIGENEESGKQHYLGSQQAAFHGHGVVTAWRYPGGCGNNVKIAVVDRNAHFTHQDFVDADIENVDGSGPGSTAHGTMTLGVLVAQNNTIGVVGIVPKAKIYFVRKLARVDGAGTSTVDRTEAALTRAISKLDPGDVLLLEDHVEVNDDGEPLRYLPSESHECIFQCIHHGAVDVGIIVVEPAGNAEGEDGRLASLKSWGESGAVMVGGCTANAADFWKKSNHGVRVNCCGWAESVFTTWEGDDYGDYSGTSSASAVVAGAIAQLQSILIEARRPAITAVDLVAGAAAFPGVGNPSRVGGCFDVAALAAARGAVMMPNNENCLGVNLGIE